MEPFSYLATYGDLFDLFFLIFICSLFFKKPSSTRDALLAFFLSFTYYELSLSNDAKKDFFGH